MGRFLKIAVYIAVLFLGYLWIATVAKSCNKSNTASNDDTEMVDDIAYEDEFADDFFEDEEEDTEESVDEMGGGSESSEEFDITESETMDYTEIDEIIEDTKTESVTHSAPIRQSSSSGKYLLLAGSYLIEDNASQMVRKLKKMGYDNAEVVIFEMSQYHSVCAGRFSSRSAAKQESNSLKRKGVDNYVHTKQ